MINLSLTINVFLIGVAQLVQQYSGQSLNIYEQLLGSTTPRGKMVCKSYVVVVNIVNPSLWPGFSNFISRETFISFLTLFKNINL